MVEWWKQHTNNGHCHLNSWDEIFGQIHTTVFESDVQGFVADIVKDAPKTKSDVFRSFNVDTGVLSLLMSTG